MSPIVLVMLAALPQGTGPPGAGNPCVTCHESLPEPSAAAHSFAEWRASAHAGAVTCDKCHGGDTTATAQAAAHRDVYPSHDYKSKVYRTRVPATCGACHQQELGFFTESAHFAAVVSTGQGPTCVTCHGSMAIRALAPENLDSACGGCHGAGGGAPPAAPAQARRLLTLLLQTDSALGASQSRVQLATEPRRRQASRFLREAQDSLERARQAWHAFNVTLLERTLRASADAVRRADSVVARRAGP